MPKFIVFEGLDGSGKSEISKRVAKKIDAVWLKTPPTEFSSIRSYVDESNDEYLRFHYYMLGNAFIADQVTKIQQEGKNVICDRYVDSTLVYFQFFGLDIDAQAWRNSLKKPDIQIFLDISYEERMCRLRARGNNTRFDEQTKSRHTHEGLRDLYLKNGDWLVVDVANFCDKIEEEVDWIVSKIHCLPKS